MTVGGNPVPQALEDSVNGRGINVMENAVDQDEIKTSCRSFFIFPDVGYDETAIVFPAGMFNVTRINVNSEVIGMCKKLRVRARAAADVEHAPRLTDVIVREHGRQFCRGERRLPETVDGGLFEQVAEQSHKDQDRSGNEIVPGPLYP